MRRATARYHRLEEALAAAARPRALGGEATEQTAVVHAIADALRADRAPNVRGAELLGYSRDYGAALSAAEAAGVVLVLDDPLAPVRTNGALIYLGTVLPDDAPVRAADVVLPLANVAEEEGTFVNRDGRVQRYFQAKPAPGMARPAWWVLGELTTTATHPASASAAEAFARFAAAADGAAGMSYTTLGLSGQVLGTEAGVPA